jgi:glutamyl-tRNA reductase
MTQSPPELLVLGTSHAVASAGVRERLHVDLDDLYRTLGRLLDRGVLDEAVPLATCGRLEVYLVTQRRHRALGLLGSLVTRHTGISGEDLASHTFHRAGREAARHLFRVAAGLDSVIHGEAQILGQVRDALHHPATVDTAGPWLQRLFQSALKTGKRVRTETEIGRGALSLAGVALSSLRRTAGSLDGMTVVVLGAGDTGALIARLLRKGRVGRLIVANRTLERAREVAAEAGGEAASLEDLPRLLASADVVIGTVAEREGLVSAGALAGADARPRWFLDLAHPRNFDPALEALPGVHLMDLEQVFRRVEKARRERASQVPHAEAIVEEDADGYAAWMRSRGSLDVLRAIRAQVLDLARHEAARRSRGLGKEEREALQRFARSVARTLLHGPTVAIRNADPASPEGRRLIDSAASLFGIAVNGNGAADDVGDQGA